MLFYVPLLYNSSMYLVNVFYNSPRRLWVQSAITDISFSTVSLIIILFDQNVYKMYNQTFKKTFIYARRTLLLKVYHVDKHLMKNVSRQSDFHYFYFRRIYSTCTWRCIDILRGNRKVNENKSVAPQVNVAYGGIQKFILAISNFFYTRQAYESISCDIK